MDALDAQSATSNLISTAGPNSPSERFEQVARLIHRLRTCSLGRRLPRTCILTSPDTTLSAKMATRKRRAKVGVNQKAVRVWLQTTQAPRGSKTDRHEQISPGTIGVGLIKLLNDKRLAHPPSVAEFRRAAVTTEKNIALLNSWLSREKVAQPIANRAFVDNR